MTSENIYQAPEAELAVESSESEKDQFFTTASRKLIVLSIFTLNIYSLYWFYKHWEAQKLNAERNCMPVLRAIFQVFFVYSLFSIIRKDASSKGINASWGAGLFATVYILLQITSGIVGQLSGDPADMFNLILVSWMVSFISIIPIAIVQKTANRINGDPDGKQNERFTGLNWLCVGLGAIYWGLVILGTQLAV